jgi:hypothetical protein
MPALLSQPWTENDDALKPSEVENISEMVQSVGGMFGFGAPPPPPPKNEKFFDREEFEDISLWRVSLGYGIPTLLAIGLATLVFCRRDL